MKIYHWILIAIVAVIGFATGYQTGHLPVPTPPEAPAVPLPVIAHAKPKATSVEISQPTSTIEQFETALHLQNRRDFSKLIQTIATLDPKKIREAIAAAEKTPNRQARNLALQQLLSQWLEADFSGAEAWIKQLPPGQFRNQAFSQLASKLAETNPQAALALLDNIPAGQNRQQMLWPIFNQWATKSPVDAAPAARQGVRIASFSALSPPPAGPSGASNVVGVVRARPRPRPGQAGPPPGRPRACR